MDRTRFIEHRGHRIILLDFRDLREAALALGEIQKAREFFARQAPDGSHLTLTDARDCLYNSETLTAMKELTRHNKPYVRAAAVVTSNALHRVAVTAIGLFSKRKIQVFAEPEAAKDWLVEQ